jgi:Rod binding domain-containing protein
MPGPLAFLPLQRPQALPVQAAAAALPVERAAAPHAGERLKLERSAQDFESLLLGMMLRSMRASTDVLAEDADAPTGTGLMRDVMDENLSIALAHGGGIGLGHDLGQQLEAQSARHAQAKDSAAGVRDGGTR